MTGQEQALFDAIMNEDTDEVIRLSNIPDLNINAVDDVDGNTGLHWAAGLGLTDIVEQLVRHEKILVNIKNKFGDTALHWAARHGHQRVVDILLTHQLIQIYEENNNGNTPQQAAEQDGHIDVAKSLHQYKLKRDEQMQPTSSTKVDMWDDRKYKRKLSGQ